MGDVVIPTDLLAAIRLEYADWRLHSTTLDRYVYVSDLIDEIETLRAEVARLKGEPDAKP